MQLTAMTIRINDMVARKGGMPHTKLVLIVVSQKMKGMIVHFHLLFIRMKMVTT
jgi:hypothetical protein